MYSSYIFDLYGTIIDIQTSDDDLAVWEDLSIYLSYNECDYSPIQLRLHIEQAKQEQLLRHEEEGKVEVADYDMEACFQTLQNRDGHQIETSLAASCTKLYRALTMHRLQVYDGVPELLRTLKQQGKSVYVLCNGQRAFVEPELKLLELYDLFDGIAISSDAGCAKPDPRFFQYLSQTYGVDLSRALMIGDDHVTDLAGAQAAQVDMCYIDSDDSAQSHPIPEWAKHRIGRGDLKQILELKPA
ncbi:HAD family hydrolase [Marinicrinis lubricantis]|uniref:HAD family hydrolase n=1 Tax=Marinicrinis lubricantis TaxID=2086470 RepID=A0ABW1IK83_9BACL